MVRIQGFEGEAGIEGWGEIFAEANRGGQRGCHVYEMKGIILVQQHRE